MEAASKQYSCLAENYICVKDVLHGYRVGSLALRICNELAMDEKQKIDIVVASIFHDIGKALIDNEILNKLGKLTERERSKMKYHVFMSAQIAHDANFYEESIQSIFNHHENWNGTGYPVGKKGEVIPIGARILKICDVFDALTSDRPYRKGYTLKEALSIMDREVGSFDPKIYNIFKEVMAVEN